MEGTMARWDAELRAVGELTLPNPFLSKCAVVCVDIIDTA